MPYFARHEILWAGRTYGPGEMISVDPIGNLDEMARVGTAIRTPSGHRIARKDKQSPWQIVECGRDDVPDATGDAAATLVDLRTEVDGLRSRLDGSRQAHDATQQTAIGLARKNDELKGQVAGLLSQVDAARADVEAAHDSADRRLRKRLETSRDACAVLRKQAEGLDEDRDRLRDQIEEMRERTADPKDLAEVTEQRDLALAKIEEMVAEAGEQRSAATAKIAELTAEVEELSKPPEPVPASPEPTPEADPGPAAVSARKKKATRKTGRRGGR